MRVIFIVIIFGLFAFTNYSFGYEPTPKQKEFELGVESLLGVVDATWEGPVSLWIKVDLDTLGYPYKERAKRFADHMARNVKSVSSLGACVHVYYGNRNRLAKSCS